MNNTTSQFLCIVLLLGLVSIGTGSEIEFPDLSGWMRSDTPDHYTEQTLYDYINGAADLYLRYDFRELDVMNYENTGGAFITIDVYEHGDEVNAFGIYSQERLPSSNRIPVGVEGYLEQGILNFLKGRYYVKISGYGLEGDSLLTAVAVLIEETIEGRSQLLREFSYFPDNGRVQGTEMFIASDYLGHEFLQSVYTVDYDCDGITVTMFLINAADTEGARGIVDSFCSLAECDDDSIRYSSSVVSLHDPYHQSNGDVFLRRDERYVWGVYSKDENLAERLLSDIKNPEKE